jgi:hypothetical protein
MNSPLRLPAILAEAVGAQDAVDEITVLRMHQAVLSAVTLFPERTPFARATLVALLEDLGAPAAAPAALSGPIGPD